MGYRPDRAGSSRRDPVVDQGNDGLSQARSNGLAQAISKSRQKASSKTLPQGISKCLVDHPSATRHSAGMSSKTPPPNPAYPNGMDGILDQMNARRAPLGFARGEALPPLDCDLDGLARTTVTIPADDTRTLSDNARKTLEIAKELKGQNGLPPLNALLIAHLRKRSQPTFGDHGKTPEQRSAGLGLSTLFGMMKLYESERLFSGRDPGKPFTLDV